MPRLGEPKKCLSKVSGSLYWLLELRPVIWTRLLVCQSWTIYLSCLKENIVLKGPCLAQLATRYKGHWDKNKTKHVSRWGTTILDTMFLSWMKHWALSPAFKQINKPNRTKQQRSETEWLEISQTAQSSRETVSTFGIIILIATAMTWTMEGS